MPFCTGSSTGIGRQAALDFAAEGAAVTLQGESAANLDVSLQYFKRNF